MIAILCGHVQYTVINIIIIRSITKPNLDIINYKAYVRNILLGLVGICKRIVAYSAFSLIIFLEIFQYYYY